jgi:hypothetical protein
MPGSFLLTMLLLLLPSWLCNFWYSYSTLSLSPFQPGSNSHLTSSCLHQSRWCIWVSPFLTSSSSGTWDKCPTKGTQFLYIYMYMCVYICLCIYINIPVWYKYYVYYIFIWIAKGHYKSLAQYMYNIHVYICHIYDTTYVCIYTCVCVGETSCVTGKCSSTELYP